MVEQELADRVVHSKKLMLTQFMEGDFGVSLAEDESMIQLYRITNASKET